jgi:SAM-dependent methyltransferase
VVHDADGSWAATTENRFDLVVALSVLHHIPDYLRAVETYARVTTPGGTFVCWQDPLWYERLPRSTRLAARAAYFGWRLRQGDFRRGIATRIRRLRGTYDTANPSDMSEYHVVRKGVDEDALVRLLQRWYGDVRVATYWATQSSIGQRVGEQFGFADTFTITARERLATAARTQAVLP